MNPHDEASRDGDTPVVWRLDRLGQSLKHLIESITALQKRNIGFKSLTEQKDLPRVSSCILLRAVLTGQRLWRVHSPLEYLHQFPNYSTLIRPSPAFFRSSLLELLKQAQEFRSHRQMTNHPIVRNDVC